MSEQAYDRCDLRFGNICSLYYRDILGKKSVPKQIDLLDEFFPGLAVWEVDSDGSLVLRDDHAISDPCAYMESLPPEQIERPTSPEHMDLYETLMERSKKNHSWWVANTAEFQADEKRPVLYDDRRRAIPKAWFTQLYSIGVQRTKSPAPVASAQIW